MARVALVWFFFFFQAEDGIRDVAVTGVQTCALPISPPRLELARLRDEAAHDVDPAARAAHRVEFLALDRRMRDDGEKPFVTPYVVLERRDVEVADQNGARARGAAQRRAVAHLVEELELVRE